MSVPFDWRSTAKPYQVAPEGDWDIWFLTGSRGAGTTRAGVEWVREQARIPDNRIVVVMRTDTDTREVFVEGESGIFAVSPIEEQPKYEPARRTLTWPNGAKAFLVGAQGLDTLRGVQANAGLWMDPKTDDTDTLGSIRLAVRLGENPQILVAGMLNRPGPLFDEINRTILSNPVRTRLTAGSWELIQEHHSPQWIKVMKDMGII